VTTDLVAHDEADLSPRFVVSLEELRQQIVALDQFKRDIMQDGTDYAVIPGTPKPSLLKPGAEKLCEAFGWRPKFAILDSVRDWEGGFFHYEVECRLLSKRTGEDVGNGLGEANSLEGRYRWREARPSCERCGFELRRARDRAEWYCWRAKGGCGATYPLGQIEPGGKVENDDPYTLVNTLLKMAQKRALVAATLVAAAASGIFTTGCGGLGRRCGATERARQEQRECAGDNGQAGYCQRPTADCTGRAGVRHLWAACAEPEPSKNEPGTVRGVTLRDPL
jgi:hypothetical protein